MNWKFWTDDADRRPPGERAARWRLRFLEPPDLNGLQTVPFWRADAVPPPVRDGGGADGKIGGSDLSGSGVIVTGTKVGRLPVGDAARISRRHRYSRLS